MKDNTNMTEKEKVQSVLDNVISGLKFGVAPDLDEEDVVQSIIYGVIKQHKQMTDEEIGAFVDYVHYSAYNLVIIKDILEGKIKIFLDANGNLDFDVTKALAEKNNNPAKSKPKAKKKKKKNDDEQNNL